MLGTGLSGVPLAPGIPPMPLDPPPTPAQIAQMNAQEALAELDKFNADQSIWNGQCSVAVVGPLPPGPYSACMDRLAELNARRAAIVARLNQLGIRVEDLPPGATAPPSSVPGQSAPNTTAPSPSQPGTQQPNAPGGPNLDQQATQIGREASVLAPGTRSDAIADKVTGLHLNQEQAAEAADIAAKTAFGETAGIANLPDGAKVVLPVRIDQGIALMVHPDGSVTVFRGDLHQFLPFLGG